eukprot:731947-Prorocentrum_minimum.AAC.1
MIECARTSREGMLEGGMLEGVIACLAAYIRARVLYVCFKCVSVLLRCATTACQACQAWQADCRGGARVWTSLCVENDVFYGHEAPAFRGLDKNVQ